MLLVDRIDRYINIIASQQIIQKRQDNSAKNTKKGKKKGIDKHKRVIHVARECLIYDCFVDDDDDNEK